VCPDGNDDIAFGKADLSQHKSVFAKLFGLVKK
jgi:hypothetical protein